MPSEVLRLRIRPESLLSAMSSSSPSRLRLTVVIPIPKGDALTWKNDIYNVTLLVLNFRVQTTSGSRCDCFP